MEDTVAFTITVNVSEQSSTVKADDPNKVTIVSLVAAAEAMCHLVAEGIEDLSSEDSYDRDLENFIVATLVRAITGVSKDITKGTKTYTLEEVLEE